MAVRLPSGLFHESNSALHCEREADELFYSSEEAGGNLQPVDAKVLTPHGWEAIGDLEVGRSVCATDGTTANVIGVFQQEVADIHRFTMRDGSSTECGLDHIWLAWPTHKKIKKGNVPNTGSSATRKYTTRMLLAEMDAKPLSSGRRRGFVVPVVEPVSLQVAGGCVGRGNFVGRPIDAYFLGLLIGDGSFVRANAISLTSADDQITAYLRDLAVDDLTVREREGNAAKAHRFRGTFKKTLVCDLESLGLIGKRAADKTIPRQYLFGPIDVRWSLLQGLMDTDGWVEAKRACYYTTVSQTLANDVVHLARSLGGITSVSEKMPTYESNGEKRQGQRAYCVRIRIDRPDRLFCLERKRSVANEIQHQSEGRIIDRIEFSRRAEAACIQVSHPNSLYVTHDFIVTHNSDIC